MRLSCPHYLDALVASGQFHVEVSENYDAVGLGEAAIGSRPRNCFGNCRLKEVPQRLRGGLLPCTFTHTGTKAAPGIST